MLAGPAYVFNPMRTNKTFNIIINGIGGQGIITLTRVLAEAALIEKLDVKTAELHGLSQRGGSVETHIRFGKDVASPLVGQAGADLVLSLELQEGLRAGRYGSKKRTVLLVDDFVKPIFGAERTKTTAEIEGELKKFCKKIILVPASKIAKEKLGNEVLAGIFILGWGVFKKIIPLKYGSILRAMEKIIPEKYLSLNKKAFNLAADL